MDTLQYCRSCPPLLVERETEYMIPIYKQCNLHGSLERSSARQIYLLVVSDYAKVPSLCGLCWYVPPVFTRLSSHAQRPEITTIKNYSLFILPVHRVDSPVEHQ